MKKHSRSPGRRPKAAAPSLRTVELAIESLGARGDGIARLDDQLVFVPETVPGDRVLARVDGRRGDGLAASLVEVLAAGPGRVAPPCGHFGRCGGCAVQHLDEGAYTAWKTAQLTEALRRAGFDPGLVAPLIRVPPGSRRRAAFAFHRGRGAVALGFNARASHQVVDLAECRLLAPPLLALLPALRGLLAETAEEDGDAVVTLTDSGLDLLVEAPARLDLFDRQRLAAFAETADLARLSWRRPAGGTAEPIVERRRPVVRFGGVAVGVPAGSFLQPSAEGEGHLAALAVEGVGPAARIADLYAGCGSLTFPLARQAAVHAVEGERAALEALTTAAHQAGSRVTGEARDLALRPLQGDELKSFDAVVFDPPRVGAAAQAEALAKSGPSRVVAVSCNPATLARDARTLAQGGYRLITATPVDQFPWSAHLEAVAVFER